MTTIAVLGGGYAGLRAARKLAHAKVPARIVLVNKHPYHYQSTQLHQLAAGTKEEADICFPMATAVPKKVNVVIDEVERVDREGHQVFLKSHPPIAYDYLLNALGFESESFGIEGVEENSLPLVDVDTALAARRHLEETLARYRTSGDDLDLSILVCGAGFTSIEYLGELVYRLPELAKRYDFPMEKVKIGCIEAADKILPMFDRKLADWATDYLRRHGVVFHTSTPITAIRPGQVVSNDATFSANTIIWATGVKGSSVIPASGYSSKRNRVVVQDDLSVEGNPREFLIGDVSAVLDPSSGRPYPTTAQVSIAQADCAAANVVAELTGRPTGKFSFKSVGTVCSLGPKVGVAQIDFMGHWKLKGWIVGIVKKMVNDRSVLEVADVKTVLGNN
ncbi:NADH dehydrogenase, FAD-containing subunit [Bifidobacterium actinocoloniiforme DSM 22766]|uniref:NADH dehydrogenase, FAD-containing subunit n=1 Tax=Bifidobacterium actinocoloniiforme DSM 22766 TaxID=1437605 RepID=A0A086Z1V5_9BIFI|nr:NAD(P)/FAD-dependent oxidoreductase [Bifidobacterium actinocoloniiforme]AKV55606.1 pyridine nucleotide-disulfide oxidoreductase [Bifidobacterium actinocoloniiforme DSM 22766]KFI40505.1 NADH dehydrogenase, FAD-containing subunit [Bifidobacterium actinocoloniiforme DSM 22766]